MKDFIPQNWSAFAEWFLNFAAQFAALAGKYSLSEQVESVNNDATWINYWAQARVTARAQDKQLTDYMNAVSAGETGSVMPSAPVWSLPANAPREVPPGIKHRIRSLSRQIKANPAYTRADGELLGIVAMESAARDPQTTAPELKCRSLPNFSVEVEFRRYGFDALKVEARQKGGTWQLASILISSPGVFNLIPKEPGTAEQIEIRGIYMLKNQTFGNYSPIYNSVISA